jgi:hypothetical protein
MSWGFRLAQATTGADGSFVVSADQTPAGSILYLVAIGGTPAASKQGGNNPAIALLSVQFLDGPSIQCHALGLHIAAGNVPNFVDITTGGWGEAIQGPLNGGQTPTMANFATLADVLPAAPRVWWMTHAPGCSRPRATQR